MVQETATLLYKYGAKTSWISGMTLDVTLVQEVQKLILLMNIIFGVDLQSQTLLVDLCHSLSLQIGNKTQCKGSIFGTIMMLL
jgi:hypothetical protein